MFLSPNKIILGKHVVQQLGKEVIALGGHKVLIVSDPGVAKAGLVEIVEKVLVSEGVEVNVFAEVEPEPPVRIVDECVRFSGVGNITALKVREGESHFTSMNGIVGRNLKVVKTFSYPYSEGDVIVMHSDGIEKLDIARYDLSRDLRDLGEEILSKHRVDDDSTILLAR